MKKKKKKTSHLPTICFRYPRCSKMNRHVKTSGRLSGVISFLMRPHHASDSLESHRNQKRDGLTRSAFESTTLGKRRENESRLTTVHTRGQRRVRENSAAWRQDFEYEYETRRKIIQSLRRVFVGFAKFRNRNLSNVRDRDLD